MTVEMVSSCIQPLISCIGTPVIRQFGYMIKAKDHVDELINLAGNLEAKKKDIKEQLDAAERYGQQPTEEVRRWIEKVEVKVTKVQSDYNQIEGRCWPNCWSSYKIGRSASKLLIKLDDLEKERAGFGVLVRDAPSSSVQPMSSTSILVGNMINLNKVKICGYLREETDRVIGIWGMGGVGKTTLLEAINDNFLNNNNGNSVTTNKLFDHVIFIVVSKDHQLENLQKMIVKKLGLRSSEDLVSQAQIIFEYLKEKNFLLLLDDIWKVVQLKDLGIPDPRSNSSERRFRRKVVFTTRSLQVCTGMKCHKTIKAKCLEPGEAQDLFKKNVGEDKINLPGISSRAEEVIEECGGLPLALVVIGRAMATKESPQEWDYALTQLRKSQPNKIPGMETEEEHYFSRLKFSCDSLRDDQMRECFLCCSLWPEDSEIEKEEIIMCWMGLGLINGFGDIKDAYDEGYSLIGSLTVASLLEPVHKKEYVIKVHDVIRDLALWIAHDSGTNINKWLVKAGVGLEEVHSEVAKWGEAERISLMDNRIKELPPRLPMCPNLSILILRSNWQLIGIPADFFTRMPNLTYFDLSQTHVQEFPKEICCLDQLRYLNLSNTDISTLPEELGQLKRLKYLLLGCTRLREVRGIIGRLQELEYLDLYPYGSVPTDELLSLPSLKGVGMRITSEQALQPLYRVVPPILYLNIEDEDEDRKGYKEGDSSSTTSIYLHYLLSSRTQRSLRELRFVNCRSIRELVGDVDVRLPSLESLGLEGLTNLTDIVWRSVVPPSECFPRLRFLSINECDGLKDITWVLHLPCLEQLSVSWCYEMEQLVVIGGGGEERERVTKPPTFPRLTLLSLDGLPKLAMICDNHDAASDAVNFPSLEALHVRRCKGLKKLPLNNNNCSRLRMIEGEREWWDGIEWEDDQSSLLQPYFQTQDLGRWIVSVRSFLRR